MIKGLAPAEYLARLGADPQGNVEGFDDYTDRDFEFLDTWNDRSMVGAASVDGLDGEWTLAFELNGIVGIDERLMGAASAGTEIISHYCNINALKYFSWWKDGELRTRFEWPTDRSGTTPDALANAIAQVGMHEGTSQDRIAEYFALAELLTGVRVTADLLDNATYATGIVTMPAA